MAAIKGLVAISHSPFWDISRTVEGPGADFAHGVAHARAQVAAAQADAFVVFGPDHFRNFFYDVMPPFCIGIEGVSGFGDYGTPKGELPAARGLGRAIHESVTEAGFDPAFSLSMGVDHGISQPYAVLDPAMRTPIVPIMVNASGAPRPSLRRCHEFGKAVGSAIRTSAAAQQVVVLASGGLSHWIRPVSADDPETPEDTRDYTINGRARAPAYSAMRDDSLRQRIAEGVDGEVNADWDRWFLDTLASGDLEQVFAIPDAELQARAGNGAHEVRTWLAALGAWGGPVVSLSYEPVRKWVTGMGCLSGFDSGDCVAGVMRARQQGSGE
jgi:2,3-dihydroxyphenylpropionate 1,2-dioxygenase